MTVGFEFLSRNNDVVYYGSDVELPFALAKSAGYAAGGSLAIPVSRMLNSSKTSVLKAGWAYWTPTPTALMSGTATPWASRWTRCGPLHPSSTTPGRALLTPPTTSRSSKPLTAGGPLSPAGGRSCLGQPDSIRGQWFAGPDLDALDSRQPDVQRLRSREGPPLHWSYRSGRRTQALDTIATSGRIWRSGARCCWLSTTVKPGQPASPMSQTFRITPLWAPC